LSLNIGGFVRKGEKATAIVLLKRITVTGEGEETEEGGDGRREVSFLRSFAVFNVAQTEGLPERLRAPETPRPEGERHAAAEAFLAALGADVRHAEYINDWLRLLKADVRAVVTAASKASLAADYLRSFSRPVDPTDDTEA
jgi:antirestriction protein ArdC